MVEKPLSDDEKMDTEMMLLEQVRDALNDVKEEDLTGRMRAIQTLATIDETSALYVAQAIDKIFDLEATIRDILAGRVHVHARFDGFHVCDGDRENDN